MRPLLVSKLNTVSQIVLAGVALGEPAFGLSLTAEIQFLVAITVVLTGRVGRRLSR